MDKKSFQKFLCIDEGYNSFYIKELDRYQDFIFPKTNFGDLRTVLFAIECDGAETSRYTIGKSIARFQKFLDDSFADFPNGTDLNRTNEEIIGANRKEKGSTNNECLDGTGVEEYRIEYQIEYIKTIINLYLSDNEGENILNGIYDTLKINKTIKLDERLKNLYVFLLDNLITLAYNRDSIEQFLEILKKCISITLEDGKYDHGVYQILIFYCQVMMSVLSETMCNIGKDQLFDEALTYFEYSIAEVYYSEKRIMSGDALGYAERSLRINDSVYLHKAFYNFGLIAIELKDLQLANDILVTWIKKEKVGELKQSVVSQHITTVHESEWRKTEAGELSTAQMLGKLALVRGLMGVTYELGATPRRLLLNMGRNDAKEAERLNPNDATNYSTLGWIMSQAINTPLNNEDGVKRFIGNKEDALRQYMMFRDRTESGSDGFMRIRSCQMCCQTLEELIFLESLKKEKDGDASIKEYYGMLADITREYHGLFLTNYSSVKPEYNKDIKLLNRIVRLSDSPANEMIYDICILLISIVGNVHFIKEYLHRREYLSTNYYSRVKENEERRKEPKKIAYYTTLSNITHVFEEYYVDEYGNGKVDKERKVKDTRNCLTVMNARYMNDPNEGVAILSELMKDIHGKVLFSKKKAKDILNDVFDENFVFLKSFTERVDKLTMWNRYANDYSSDGNNSNGVCAVVDPECFASDFSYPYDLDFSSRSTIDDYTLYRIVYLSQKGEILEQSNEGLHENVPILYNNLKKLLVQLNDCVDMVKRKMPEYGLSIADKVENILMNTLLNIVFLFKYDDYSDEQESRLILFRNRNNQQDIRILPTAPPMLALNPDFQIFIKEIILGPNVRNVEKWKPYFQYQLNEMWNKHPDNFKYHFPINGKEYEIKKSEIDYLT
jgi:hypothetical protein